MGLFDKIFQPKKNKEMEQSLQNATTTFQLLNAYEPMFSTFSGELYEANQVRSAIDCIARHAAKLKVSFQGKSEPRLKSLLEQRPNSFQNWYQFIYRAVTILYMQNNLFICPLKDKDMNTTGYIPLLPSSVSLVDYKDEIWVRFRFSNGEIAACKFSECALLTRFQYRDDLFGSTNSSLQETMSLIKLNSESVKEAVKNSNSFRFMASLSNFSKDEDLQKESKRFSDLNFSRESSSGALLLFPNTYRDIKQISSSPMTVDSHQMELIDKNINEYFGVNKYILDSSANGEQLDAFYNGTIESISIQLSESMTGAIFTDKEIRSGNSILFTANRLQYMPISQKISMVQQLMDRGVLSLNEARELFNYCPLEEDNGNIHYIRGEYKQTDEHTNEPTEAP